MLGDDGAELFGSSLTIKVIGINDRRHSRNGLNTARASIPR
jgi:hypothetical protein